MHCLRFYIFLCYSILLTLFMAHSSILCLCKFAASSDALLICSLVCLQRILENFAEFIFKNLPPILIIISRLCCICDYTPSTVLFFKLLIVSKSAVVIRNHNLQSINGEIRFFDKLAYLNLK